MNPSSPTQELEVLGSRLAAGTLTCLAYRDALTALLRRHFNCTSVSLMIGQSACACACHDARSDRVLDELAGRCVHATAPRAFLDALVAINGRVLGVLSCHLGASPRHWTLAEATKLKRLGARVALHLARRDPSRFGLDCSYEVHGEQVPRAKPPSIREERRSGDSVEDGRDRDLQRFCPSGVRLRRNCSLAPQSFAAREPVPG